MITAKRLATTATAILLLLGIAYSQEQATANTSEPTITVTASANADRVRFTAPSTVVQIRLEVYASSGEKLLDNEIRGGNLVNWHLHDGQAGPLADQTYLCVVTVKSLSGS